MQKLTDAQATATTLMGMFGKMVRHYNKVDWCFKDRPFYFVRNETMQSIVRLGLVKIDDCTATLTEGAEKD